MRIGRTNFRKLWLEKLEPRLQLNGLAISVTDERVRRLAILPNAADQVIAQVNIKASYAARIDGIRLVPAPGSAPLAQNIVAISIWADWKNGRKDGYETIVAVGNIDFNAGAADFPYFWHPIWAGPGGAARLQVKASFSNYPAGEKLGIKVGDASFIDAQGSHVAPSRISYKGSAVLHKVEYAVLSMAQLQSPPAATVYAGQSNVNLFQFGVWGRDSRLQSVSIVAMQGSIKNAANYRLLYDAGWDGFFEGSFAGKIYRSGKDYKAAFNLGKQGGGYGSYCVVADIVDNVPQEPLFQASLLQSSVTGKNIVTGKKLVGVSCDGLGTGQVQLWNQENSTLFTIARQPQLFIHELLPVPGVVSAGPGESFAIESFTAYAGQDLRLSRAAFAAGEGSWRNIAAATLWVDSNNDSFVDTRLAPGQLQDGLMAFDFDWFIAQGTTARFEVIATLSGVLWHPFFRSQLHGNWGVGAKRAADNSLLAIDRIFTDYNPQVLLDSSSYAPI